MMTQTTSRTDKKCPSWGLLILSNIVVFAIAGLFFSHPMIWTPESISYASLSSLAVISENEEREPLSYIPSPIESYFLDHGVELGLNVERPEPSGCTDWKSKTSPIASELAAFRSALRVYNAKMAAFPGTVKDLRQHISTNHSICDTLNLHPEGLKGIFPSGTLTQTSHGLLEPLFPPMRHPDFCFDGRSALMSLDYLVHDFSSYCRKLKPTSRTVLVDLGASLDFHGKKTSPAIYLTESFQRFGFHFDHIYAFEISKKEPEEVFQRIPQDLLAAYHWINVGVNSEHNSTRNPWNMIRKSYNEDDFGEYPLCTKLLCC